AAGVPGGAVPARLRAVVRADGPGEGGMTVRAAEPERVRAAVLPVAADQHVRAGGRLPRRPGRERELSPGYRAVARGEGYAILRRTAWSPLPLAHAVGQRRHPAAGRALLPQRRRHAPGVRQARNGPSAARDLVLAQPPGARPAEPGSAASPVRPRPVRHRRP